MSEVTAASSELAIGPARAHIDALWERSIVPTLIEYVQIPNRSPLFDRDWQAHGHMERAVALAEAWARSAAPADATVEVARLPGRTPLLLIDVPGKAPGNVLLYGHLDKQPELSGWSEGLGPWTPVIRDGRLYGRGAADDGYALFAALAAIQTLRAQNVAHARCLVFIECSEESGSPDLPAYMEHLADRVGVPDLVVALDSGCGSYDRLWCTTSLRGIVGGVLTVDVLERGVHSGDAGGVVPSSFRIARLLLDRLENPATGEILLPELRVPIPPSRVEQARESARILGTGLYDRFPFAGGTRPGSTDQAELVLNRTWRSALEVTGADGLPSLAEAGNVLRSRTALRLSLRTPPTADAQRVSVAVKRLLEADPPSGARVRFDGSGQPGWEAPRLAPWLERALDEASRAWFDQAPVYMGEGGTIPFMHMLGERYPSAQFVITGVLGPGSNAHGPDEFLDLATARRLSGCVAQLLTSHARK